ncbi:MAG: hypothetical protein ABIU09_03900 [Pyrinomonadaceae bacterium]
MKAEKYVGIIMRDETEEIASETPTIYESARIERIYEFNDGAVVKYEWQDQSLQQFNHRFTLVKPPSPNTAKLSAGVIKTIDY